MSNQALRNQIIKKDMTLNIYRKKVKNNHIVDSDNSTYERSYLYALVITFILLLILASSENQTDINVPPPSKGSNSIKVTDSNASSQERSKSGKQGLKSPILIGSYSEKELEQLKDQQSLFWNQYQKAEPSDRAQMLVSLVNKIVNRKNTKTRYDQALFASLQADENGIHHLGSQNKKLNRLYKRYHVDSGDEQQKQLEIERKMDIVPAALVSAVALVQTNQVEIAYLVKTNNLFAHHCEAENCNWLNNRKARNGGGTTYVLLEDSIVKFYDALNRGRQFKPLREQRRAVKTNKQRLFAVNLADDFDGINNFVNSPSGKIKEQLKQFRLE